jgi:subfamily B ATP-binding cassette protein HlyB/CyaB
MKNCKSDSVFDFELASTISSLNIMSKIKETKRDQIAIEECLYGIHNGRMKNHDLMLLCRSYGLGAKVKKVRVDQLHNIPTPAFAYINNGECVILARADQSKVLIKRLKTTAASPAEIFPTEKFDEIYTGVVVLIKAITDKKIKKKFNLSWFLPYIYKYKKLLLEVLLISVVLQILALASPLFFQVVTDKVLGHQAFSTLDVIIVGLLLVTVFESVFNIIRSYIFSHTTNKIDAELASTLFKHLLTLPLSYFESRRAGDSVSRLRELESLRDFLTGHALTLIIDAAFSVIFIGIMLFYSPKLTLVTAASIPIYVMITFFIVPILRKRLEEKYELNAVNQSTLIEVVTGIQTIKASALEGRFANEWNNKLALYLKSSFNASQIANIAQESISLTSKLTTAALLWVGARQVMGGELTIGMFIAFNMFSQRLTQPLIRMAQLWSDFQQVSVSVERLSEIFDVPTEDDKKLHNKNIREIGGVIRFDKVNFSYLNCEKLILKDLSFEIIPGTTVAFVGRSGSGKSTVTKLIQRLYLPNNGSISIADGDIQNIDLRSYRSRIGVVLQENFLFARSIRENICIRDPSASIERVIRAAQLAGAHDFITQLPNGYDTPLAEQGVGLSGGQRQRIAIARALLTNPKVLIFDEATSALDYESEAAIQNNMAKISEGRTVIIVAHRLATVQRADEIFVLDDGVIIEKGCHSELLERAGQYSKLWLSQLQKNTEQQQVSTLTPNCQNEARTYV